MHSASCKIGAQRLEHLAQGEFWQQHGAAEFGQRLAVAERFADGAGSVEELKAAWDAGLNVRVLGAAPAPWRAEDYAEAAAGDACNLEASDAALWAMLNGQSAADPEAKEDPSGKLPEGAEHRPQVSLLRDIFSNPFRPAGVVPYWLSWNDATVVKLAQGIYEDRAFDRLPVLADALEEAGCDSAEIIAHCRGRGPHVRGCWVVDLLTGRC